MLFVLIVHVHMPLGGKGEGEGGSVTTNQSPSPSWVLHIIKVYAKTSGKKNHHLVWGVNVGRSYRMGTKIPHQPKIPPSTAHIHNPLFSHALIVAL